MKHLFGIALALCLSTSANAVTLKCYEHLGKTYEDGGGGFDGMYDIPLLRKLYYALIQEMDEDQKQEARKSEQVTRLLGPCLMDGKEFTYEP